ncbi:MAG: ABC transporter permease [Alphaproteobacteria bacterium]
MRRIALLAPLDRKLLRDLRAAAGQATAIALVISAGIALFLMSHGMLRSLNETRTAYYDRYGMADMFAPVRRAPMRLVPDLKALPGVAAAEGRISASVLFDAPDTDEPVSGRVVSLPDTGTSSINRIFLRRGRMIEPFREDEVLLSEPFAEAHGLEPGDRISATLHGAKRSFTIVGIALSPEFIYTIAPGEIVPDDKRFGVMWMGYEALAAAFDLDGAFNEAVLRLTREGNPDRLIGTLDRMLERYGATGAFTRADQISDKFLTSEFEQLRTMGTIMPVIFLAVAAFLLNVVVARMIDSEREEIGLMKAFGYSDWEVAWHYTKFMLVMVAGGVVAGWGLGIWLGRGMADMYQEFFKFPFLIFRVGMDLFALSAGIAVGAALAGTIIAVRKAVVLTPAVAMQPPAPLDYSRAGTFSPFLKRVLDQPTRMILRQIRRRPVRSLLTSTGVALAVAILVMSRFNIAATDEMIHVNFHVAERQDISVNFAEARSMKAIYELQRIPGVLRVEPFRSVSVRMRNGHVERLGALTGMVEDAALSRAIDSDQQQIGLPGDGLLLSAKLAELLRLEPGETLVVDVLEDRQPRLTLEVAGTAETYVGTPAYMQLSALNRALREGSLVSGAHLAIDPAHKEEIYRLLKDMPLVAGVNLMRESEAAFRSLIEENINTFVYIVIGFASLIAVGVVYNGARIALAERRRELASLRVMGFTKTEVSYLLLGELALLTLVALPLGFVAGYGLSWYLTQAFSTELYQVPLVVNRAAYGFASAVVLVAAAVSGYLVQRDIGKLDLVSVLKTRE